MSPRTLSAAVLVVVLAASSVASAADPFTYTPAGQLVPATSGRGLPQMQALAPGMRFPFESGPAYANSQVWGHGGYLRNQGAECDKENFSYPWHDDYCEAREWTMPLCPGGTGHQGQDIRGASCKNLVHWTVATTDGTIISASGPGTGNPGYQVILAGPDGTRYRYLHQGNVIVNVGQKVKRGQRIAQVSREFDGTPTTVHLHFDIQQNVSPYGYVFVSPYMSLVRSYEALLGIADAGADADAASAPGDASTSADDADAGLPAPAAAEADAGETTVREADAPGDEGCSIAGSPRTPERSSFAALWLAGLGLAALRVRSRRRRGCEVSDAERPHEAAGSA